MKRCKKVNTRDKAWLGAVIGGVANIATSLINSYQQEQAQKKQLAAEQRMQQQQNIANANIAAQQQAGAMTNALANQNYVDEYKNKMVMKNGGYYDRLSKEKAIFKCGGKKKKKAAGGVMDGGKNKKKKEDVYYESPINTVNEKNSRDLAKIRREKAQNRTSAATIDKIRKERPMTITDRIINKMTSKGTIDAEYVSGQRKKKAAGDFLQFKCGGKKKRKC